MSHSTCIAGRRGGLGGVGGGVEDGWGFEVGWGKEGEAGFDIGTMKPGHVIYVYICYATPPLGLSLKGRL